LHLPSSEKAGGPVATSTSKSTTGTSDEAVPTPEVDASTVADVTVLVTGTFFAWRVRGESGWLEVALGLVVEAEGWLEVALGLVVEAEGWLEALGLVVEAEEA